MHRLGLVLIEEISFKLYCSVEAHGHVDTNFLINHFGFFPTIMNIEAVIVKTKYIFISCCLNKLIIELPSSS